MSFTCKAFLHLALVRSMVSQTVFPYWHDTSRSQIVRSRMKLSNCTHLSNEYLSFCFVQYVNSSACPNLFIFCVSNSMCFVYCILLRMSYKWHQSFEFYRQISTYHDFSSVRMFYSVNHHLIIKIMYPLCVCSISTYFIMFSHFISILPNSVFALT